MAVDPGVSSLFCSNLDLGFKIYSMTFDLLGQSAIFAIIINLLSSQFLLLGLG